MQGRSGSISLATALLCAAVAACTSAAGTMEAHASQGACAAPSSRPATYRRGSRGVSRAKIPPKPGKDSLTALKHSAPVRSDIITGYVESFDAENKTIVVKVSEEQLKEISARPRFAWYFHREGLPDAEDFKLTVKVSDRTRVRVDQERRGTLFALKKGEQVSVEGRLTLEDADAGPDDAFEMSAERVMLAQIACNPDHYCWKAGRCNKQCGNKPCMCKKKR